MEKSKVYFTDFRVQMNQSLLKKLRSLIFAAGIKDIDFDKKFAAIKMHFGEPGNLAFLRPNYAKCVADIVTELGGKPFVTDCNTLYPGKRKNAIDHLYAAYENGFSPLSAGCPVIIGDGLKGTDDIAVPVVGGQFVKEAKIGRVIYDADVIISLTHFKGHESTGFGGAIKNLGMGCGSRAGKMEQHNSGKPVVREKKCRGCHKCISQCGQNAIIFTEENKAVIDESACVGCGRCIGACNFDAIINKIFSANADLNRKMAEYTKAVCQDKPTFHISLVQDISPWCDCHSENDAPILPDVGMFASFDPVALDQACADACLMQEPLPNAILADNMHASDFVDHHDHFLNTTPETEWESCLEHCEKIGLGSREYELIAV